MAATDESTRAERRRIYRLAKRAFDRSALGYVCCADESDFWTDEYGTLVDTEGNGWRTYRNDWYLYKDNGSRVLAVAHLDSVSSGRFCRFTDVHHQTRINSPSLDDRLGVYVITHLLPRLGMTADWLLTTGEETGCSTAQAFESDKRYDWMFSFDRMGTDVVLYDYDTPENRRLVKATGARIGLGSFSDLCYLEHLGCAGFNWGVGYHDYHSKRAFAYLPDVCTQVARFGLFWQANYGTHLSHAQRAKPWWYEVEEECPECGSLTKYGLCESCGWDVATGKCRALCPKCEDRYLSSYTGRCLDCDVGFLSPPPRRVIRERAYGHLEESEEEEIARVIRDMHALTEDQWREEEESRE